MAVRPEDLTVDFRSLMKMTVQDRVKLAKTDPSYLSSLTPTQYAMLFPFYYRKQLPDMGLTAATSGATPISTISRGDETATPLPRFDGSKAKPGPETPAAPQKEKPKSSSSLKEGWKERVLRESKEKAVDTTEKAAIDKKGNVNKQQFYKQAVNTFKNSPLNGFVPQDGQKYGIDGSPESWAKFALRVAKVESNFNINTTNPSDPGGSFGLFQWGFHYGINKDNWRNPQAQLDAFVTYTNKWVVEGGGHILPPKEVDAKRYAGYGGFGAVFSTVRNDKVESDSAYSSLKGIEDVSEEKSNVIPPSDLGTIGPVQPEPLVVPEGLRPEIKKEIESMSEDERSKVLQAMQGVSVEKINGYYTEKGKAESITEKTADILFDANQIDQGEKYDLFEDRTPSPKERRRIAEEGGAVVNLDTNWAPKNKQTGPLIVIPDNATEEQRKRAQEYVDKVENAYRKKFGKSLSGKVLTRSENKRGRSNTFHTEPFSVNDDQAILYFTRDPEGRKILTDITATTLGKIPNVKFSLPHDPYKERPDMGAASESGLGNEVDFAKILMKDLETRRLTVAPNDMPEESIEVQPESSDITGQPVPPSSGPPGSSIIPDEASTTAQPQPTAAPVNPPYSPAVGEAMANVGPPGPTQKDYREDAAVKQENAATATPTQTEPAPELAPEPKIEEEPKKMQYGGTKQSPSGEPLGAVDMQTGKLMFTHAPGESVNYDKSGQIKVTPNQRRDSQEIESLANQVKDEVRLQSEAREESSRTQTTQMTPNPVVNREWPDTVKALSQESSHVYKTPSSGRAFDQARFIPRKDIFSLANATLKS